MDLWLSYAIIFYISGYLDKKSSVKKYFVRLFIPYLALNFLYILIEFPWRYREFGGCSFFLNEVKSIIPFYSDNPVNYPTWFLLVLFLIKCFMNFLQRNPLLLISMLIVAVLIPLKISLETHYLNLLLGGYVYYLLGWTTQRYQIYRPTPPFFLYVKNVKKCRRLLALLGVILIFLYSVISYYYAISAWWHYSESLLLLPISLLGVVAHLFLFKSLFYYSKAHWILNLSQGAIAVVGLHILGIQYSRRLLLAFGILEKWEDMNLFYSLLVSLIIMLLIYLSLPFIKLNFSWLIGLSGRKG